LSSITLTIPQARRLAVASQWLPAPNGASILDVVKHIGYLQLDPTNSIARSHLLVLWSRLGSYDEAELERLRWEDRQLYEYNAALVPMEDYPIHADTMKRFPSWGDLWDERVAEWLAKNATLRRQLLNQLRKRGPVASRDLKGLTYVGWRSTGWTNERNVTQMLHFMHRQGKVVIAGRQGQQRLWDLAERWLPSDSRLPRRDAERRVAERSARVLGVATAKEIQREYFPGGPYPGMEKAIERLVDEGRLGRAEIDGIPGERFVHVDALAALDKRPPRRTTFLSPFDPLIRNRERTEALWDFRYRIEIYVPEAKREYGYFVLPILHGDDLVGRIDPVFDRKAGVLRVKNVWWEPGKREVPLEKPLRSLAAFVGADSIEPWTSRRARSTTARSRTRQPAR
jgi:uncharacterized protein YcaQ